MIEINLLPWREEQRKAALIKQGFRALAGAILAFFLILILHFILNWQIQNLQNHLRPIKESLTQVNQRLTVLRQTYQELNGLTFPNFDVSLLVKREQHLLDFLRKLSMLFPSELYARQIRFDGQIFRIEGFSVAQNDILRFQEKFKSDFSAGKLRIWKENSLFHYQLSLGVRF